MDFIEVLQNISSKIAKQKNIINTEEATKNAFIMPFISALGYDVFDPAEVVPEFTADVGIKKGEKVDYAIKQDGKIIEPLLNLLTNVSRNACAPQRGNLVHQHRLQAKPRIQTVIRKEQELLIVKTG